MAIKKKQSYCVCAEIYNRVHWTHNTHREMMQDKKKKKAYKKMSFSSLWGLNDFISAAS